MTGTHSLILSKQGHTGKFHAKTLHERWYCCL